jgi:hypothetical protein
MSPTLIELIEKARLVSMTPQELAEQRISFAFGNANYEDERVTRETVVQCSITPLECVEPREDPST